MYHWSKNEAKKIAPHYYEYEGLRFPRWDGPLTAKQLQSGQFYFAYYGSRPLTPSEIQRSINRLIDLKKLSRAA